MGALNLTEKRAKNVKPSAVSDQISKRDCSTNFSNFNILVADVSKFSFLIKKSLLIKCNKPVLSSTVPSLPLALLD